MRTLPRQCTLARGTLIGVNCAFSSRGRRPLMPRFNCPNCGGTENYRGEPLQKGLHFLAHNHVSVTEPIYTTAVTVKAGSTGEPPMPEKRRYRTNRDASSEGNRMFKTSQASDVGSIPIARSINHDDSIVLTPLTLLKKAIKPRVMVPRWSQRNELVPTSQPEVGRRWTPVLAIGR